MRITTTPVSEVTVSRFNKMRRVLEFNPPYQREGDVWSPERRARLIDSIINGFDVPKLYFEQPAARRVTATGLAIQYAVLDGKQRLQAIAQFLDDNLALPDDFWFYENRDLDARGMTLTQLQDSHFFLARRFLEFELPIISVAADSGDLVEEMFLRLNASSALNAAERRNAISGPTRDAANDLAEHPALTAKSPIKNARYKYRELAAKFLAIEEQLDSRGRIADTKAATLYELFVATRPSGRVAAGQMASYQALAETSLDRMQDLFDDSDPLLASIGTLVVYYIAFRNAGFALAATRTNLERFETLRREASSMSEEDPEYARPGNARLREYNVFVQSSNDGRALSRRAEVLTGFIVGYDPRNELASLDALPDGDLPDNDESDDN